MGMWIKKGSGFTMLELLMVVIIVGILAALAIPQYANFAERARVSEATNTIGAIKSAMGVYRLDNGTYVGATTANIGITWPVGAQAYWVYTIPATGATTYTVTATRSARNAGGVPPAGFQGQTVQMQWDNAVGAVWAGDHPLRPI